MKLEKFLKSKGLYLKAKKNHRYYYYKTVLSSGATHYSGCMTKKQHKECLAEFNRLMDKDIWSLFVWADTPEGNNFWRDLANEFESWESIEEEPKIEEEQYIPQIETFTQEDMDKSYLSGYKKAWDDAKKSLDDAIKIYMRDGNS